MKQEVRIILVGESACGKTKLINRFINNRYTKDYSKTGFDKLETNIEVDQKSIKLTIWDTSGLASYSVLRPLVYRESDVALVCYRMDNGVSSIQNWIQEVWQTQPMPIVLAGCAMDSVSQQVIDDCSSLPESLGLDGCLTSAKTGFNSSLVFQLCVRAALNHVQAEKEREDVLGRLYSGKTKIRRPLSTVTSTRPTRPTSLKINDSGPGQLVLRTISQKQKQLRLGVSSLVMGTSSGNSASSNNNSSTDASSSSVSGKTDSKQEYISRNTNCSSPPNLFSPYSPHSSRTSMLLNSSAVATARSSSAASNNGMNRSVGCGRNTSHVAHSAQIQPNRLASRQSSRPCSRATAIPVPPPTSPGCDNHDYAVIGDANCHPVQSPTSSLLSGPFSPTSSVISGFPPPSEVSISSPFPSLFSYSRQSGHLEDGKAGGQDRLGSDIESVSSHSQADSVSLRGSRIPWFSNKSKADKLINYADPSSKDKDKLINYAAPISKQKENLISYDDHSTKHKVFCDPKPERCSIM